MKAQIKKYKMQSTSSMFSSQMGAGDDGLSVISETPSVFTGKITHAERNLTRMEGNRAKELETVKKQLQEKEDELSSLKMKHSATLARTKTLETQLNEIKGQFKSKI